MQRKLHATILTLKSYVASFFYFTVVCPQISEGFYSVLFRKNKSVTFQSCAKIFSEFCRTKGDFLLACRNSCVKMLEITDVILHGN